VTAPGRPALAWYQQLIGRIHRDVRAHLPADATVLVVSRGDDELLRLDGREGWHFPRHPDGRYGGHHPADSAEAIQHLEELREKGAQYILFPTSSRWWLEHYEEFADHLSTTYSRVADNEESCTIFALQPRSAATSRRPEMPATDTSPQLQELIDVLLPTASIAVVRGAGSGVRASGGQTVVFPPANFQGDTDAAVDAVELLGRRGVQFLVVPHAPSWLDQHPGFLPEIEQRYPLVMSQHHLCTIFELAPAQPDGAASTRDAASARGNGAPALATRPATAAPESGRRSVVQRLTGWWRAKGSGAASRDADGTP
jgi:hypothetical protein